MQCYSRKRAHISLLFLLSVLMSDALILTTGIYLMIRLFE
ncbi:hypothetical protein NBRC111894_428 [Sporolactobacillus inulinus]|uniref:Uncharacterized protein n=1 Tax=Sporolactobacillus inulinus TaxID=2078 RepID=A0A4Y1Z7A3_9BACL|nr:hypothetical protein NBRC111894_428 [Sporolactobacillus inulinus]